MAFTTQTDADTKASFTVNTGKILFVQTIFAALGEGGGTIVVEVQEDGTGFAALTISSNGSHSAEVTTPISNPFGPFSAGTVVRMQRIDGDSAKDWSGGWNGYERDA